MKKYTWWTKPNPEGVSLKDAIQVFMFGMLVFAFLITVHFLII